ncbi:hypothetical protein [Flavobacterium psychrophilum]|uniref:hypothetical protein n=1 Tax=Flavobacterium psychrophilum TaxID=96345 RepID=UPI00106C48A6|nr:hypothetical protein [Flavobacterium psychrophilum]GEJ41263.1 hypothetical protein FPN185_contig00011-0004 [Flavobacterium psychrophilum]
MSIQKIEWEDKVNSPELLAAIQQFGKKHYLSAEQINELRDKINALIIEGSTPKSDSLMYTSKRIFLSLNVLNEWRTSDAGFANADFIGAESAQGRGTTPNTWTNALIFPIPTGYILEEVLVNMNYKMENRTPSTLEFLIQREETTGTVQTNAGVNAITICNDTLSTGAGSLANNRVFKNLAVNTHLLPTLNFSYLRIAIRETQAVSYFGIILQLKFKKV